MASMRIRSAVIVISLLLVQCAGFFKGAGEAMVSDQDEAKLGAQFHQTLLTNDTARQQFPLFVPRTAAETQFQSYILGLCQQTLAAVPPEEKPPYGFTFTLIDKDEENAFAVPGGYVYLFTGILKKLQNESEMMGVLGHELTHVTHHHFREALAKNTALGLGLEVLLGTTGAGQAAQMAAGTAFQLAGLKFSRSAEADADKGGTILLGRLGRNPLGIATYFARAEKAGGPPEWLSDHPGAKNRVKAVTIFVEKDPDLSRLAADSARTDFTQRFEQHVQPAIRTSQVEPAP